MFARHALRQQKTTGVLPVEKILYDICFIFVVAFLKSSALHDMVDKLGTYVEIILYGFYLGDDGFLCSITHDYPSFLFLLLSFNYSLIIVFSLRFVKQF